MLIFRLFDENYDYIGNTEVTSFAHQIEALTVNDLMAKMARGIILEAGADIDDVTDPIVSSLLIFFFFFLLLISNVGFAFLVT